jgi:hypothetical protein
VNREENDEEERDEVGHLAHPGSKPDMSITAFPKSKTGLKVLLLGAGGREHALAWKLAQSERVDRVYVAPGNGGTAGVAGKVENVDVQWGEGFEGLVKFAREHEVSSVLGFRRWWIRSGCRGGCAHSEKDGITLSSNGCSYRPGAGDRVMPVRRRTRGASTASGMPPAKRLKETMELSFSGVVDVRFALGRTKNEASSCTAQRPRGCIRDTKGVQHLLFG